MAMLNNQTVIGKMLISDDQCMFCLQKLNDFIGKGSRTAQGGVKYIRIPWFYAMGWAGLSSPMQVFFSIDFILGPFSEQVSQVVFL
jgi:hypothetical protein